MNCSSKLFLKWECPRECSEVWTHWEWWLLSSLLWCKEICREGRPLELVFPSSSLSMILFLSSDLFIQDCVSWKYLFQGVCQVCAIWALEEESQLPVCLHPRLSLRWACVPHRAPGTRRWGCLGLPGQPVTCVVNLHYESLSFPTNISSSGSWAKESQHGNGVINSFCPQGIRKYMWIDRIFCSKIFLSLWPLPLQLTLRACRLTRKQVAIKHHQKNSKKSSFFTSISHS